MSPQGLLGNLEDEGAAAAIKKMKHSAHNVARLVEMLVDPTTEVRALVEQWAQGFASSKSKRKRLDYGNVNEEVLSDLMKHFNDPANDYRRGAMCPEAGVLDSEVTLVDPSKFNPYPAGQEHNMRDTLGQLRSLMTVAYTRYNKSGENGDKPFRDFVRDAQAAAKSANIPDLGLMYAFGRLYSLPSLNFVVRIVPNDMAREHGLPLLPGSALSSSGKRRGGAHGGGDSESEVEALDNGAMNKLLRRFTETADDDDDPADLSAALSAQRGVKLATLRGIRDDLEKRLQHEQSKAPSDEQAICGLRARLAKCSAKISVLEDEELDM